MLIKVENLNLIFGNDIVFCGFNVLIIFKMIISLMVELWVLESIFILFFIIYVILGKCI